MILWFAACQPPPLTQDAYVWQRAWTPAVVDGVLARGDRFARLAVLAAEVEADGSVSAVSPSAAALEGHRVVAVVRVGVLSETLPARVAETVARLRTDGIDVIEVQLDYDAPSARLAGYTDAVRAVRAASPVPVTLTALPDWLSRPELPALLAEADGWTLQVHDLSDPLIDDERALAAIERAAGLHRPFRVALPTYGYTVAFAPDGALIGVTAERAVPWRSGVTTRVLHADPAEVAAVVAALLADRPREVEGLVWFRLPTEQDDHCWRWSTLEAVMVGRAPAARIVPSMTGDGLVEVRVANRGDADAPLPGVTLRAAEAPVAADGYGGWAAIPRGDGVVFRAKGGASLPAGAERAVGWARFPEGAEVEIDAD